MFDVKLEAKLLKFSERAKELLSQARNAEAAFLDLEQTVERTRSDGDYARYVRARRDLENVRGELGQELLATIGIHQPGVWPWMPDTSSDELPVDQTDDDCPY